MKTRPEKEFILSNLVKLGLRVLAAALLLSQTAFSQQLNPGDGVRVTAFNISDKISGDYLVQQDGNIQLPYIGLVAAQKRDFAAIRDEIAEKYTAIYRNPELTVQPLFKINVLGEVRTPGVYYLTGVEKLSDLIAMAGGETRDANLKKILLIRGDQKIDIDAEQFLKQGRKLNDIGLESGDQVYVSRKRWLSFRNATVLISLATLALIAIQTF